jgi:hypothetical protein
MRLTCRTAAVAFLGGRQACVRTVSTDSTTAAQDGAIACARLRRDPSGYRDPWRPTLPCQALDWVGSLLSGSMALRCPLGPGGRTSPLIAGRRAASLPYTPPGARPSAGRRALDLKACSATKIPRCCSTRSTADYAVPQLRYLSADQAANARQDAFARIQEAIDRIDAGALGAFGAIPS